MSGSKQTRQGTIQYRLNSALSLKDITIKTLHYG